MESSNGQGYHKSIRLEDKHLPVPSTSNTTMNISHGESKSSENKVAVPLSIDDVSKVDVDSPFLESQFIRARAIEISLVLQCIFYKMDVSTLKSARTVNKQWKIEADKQINRRGCFRLKFDPTSHPLQEGLEELQISKDLPCFDFQLNIPDMIMKQVENFLSIFGPRVKSLTLTSRMDENALSTLLAGLSHLENLFLGSDFFETGVVHDAETPKLKIGGDLIHLKHIDYIHRINWKMTEIKSDSILSKIIENAPNLKSLTNISFSGNLLNEGGGLKWKEKISLMRSFDCPDLHTTITYADAGTRLEKLFLHSINYYLLERRRALTRLIQSSQHTLTTLVTDLNFVCLSKTTAFGPSFLPFHNLKVLQIQVDDLSWFYFGNSTRLPMELCQLDEDTFPNLNAVVLDLPDERYLKIPNQSGEFTPFPNVIGTVETLTIQVVGGGGPRYWTIDEHRLSRVNDLFPNVKNLQLKDSFEMPLILPVCFSLWPKLENLQVHVNFKRRIDMNFLSSWYFDSMTNYGNLDTVFTGLSLELCEMLRDSMLVEILEEDIEIAEDVNSKARSKNSVIFLKELRSLNIVFSDLRPRIEETVCPISPVSFMYGFNLIPNVKVKLLYDQNLKVFNNVTRKFENRFDMCKYLERLVPYCEIAHWESHGVATLINNE